MQAASLDVFVTEPLRAFSPLREHPRITLSPHNAGHIRTFEADPGDQVPWLAPGLDH